MKPIWKWIIGVFLALAIIIVAVLWYYSRNWKPIVEQRLQEVVQHSTDSLYNLSYSDLDLNIALGNVTLHDVELRPDSVVYQRMVQQQVAPNNRYHIKVKQLKVRRFSLRDVLYRKNLNIRAISFETPEIHMLSEQHSFNDTIVKENDKTFYESVKGLFTSINVKDITLDEVKFTYTTIDKGKTSDLHLDRVKILVHDVLVDETSVSDTTRLFYTKMVDVNIPGFEYELSDGFYKVKFDDLQINTQNQNMLFTKVVYQPKMNKQAFYRAKKENVTMTKLVLDTLRFEQMDFQRIIDDQQTIASKVQLKNGTVDLYSDKRYFKQPVNKIGQSPHQKLLQATKLLRIDTLLVDNISVTYHEFSGKYHKEGSISFEQAHGYLTNVTNDKYKLEQDRFMRADLSAKIMGAGTLRAKFGFDMLSDEGFHTYQGTLGSMKATAFNRILRPLLNVEIASGDIHRVAFNMEGNDYSNWGDFEFEYDDLKINLLNKPEAGEQKSSKKLTSFLVNELLINNSNPSPEGEFLKGKIRYKRVPEHTFFKTVWQSLLEGIKQSAGISPEREARLMGTAEVATGVVEGTKNVIQKTGGFFRNIFKKKDNKAEKQE